MMPEATSQSFAMGMLARVIVLESPWPLLKTNSFEKRGDRGGVGFRDAHINVIFGYMSATKVQEGQQVQEEDPKSLEHVEQLFARVNGQSAQRVPVRFFPTAEAPEAKSCGCQ
jgi:hypothetical protein